MGCSASLEKMKIQPFPFYSKKNVDLTDKQKKIIRSTWMLIERRKNDLGVEIFLRLFDSNPSLQQIFPEFRHVTVEFLATDRSLQGHTRRVMKVLENVVSTIDDSHAISEYLKELGRRHRYRQVSPKPVHLQEISKSILLTFASYLGGDWTPEVSNAWQIFIEKIMGLISEGLTSVFHS